MGTCETNVASAINQAQAAQSTANGCYDDVSIADNVLTFKTASGESKDITLPSRTFKLLNAFSTDYHNPISINVDLLNKYSTPVYGYPITDTAYINPFKVSSSSSYYYFVALGQCLSSNFTSGDWSNQNFAVDTDTMLNKIKETILKQLDFSNAVYNYREISSGGKTLNTLTLKFYLHTMYNDIAYRCNPIITLTHDFSTEITTCSIDVSVFSIYVDDGIANTNVNVPIALTVYSASFT